MNKAHVLATDCTRQPLPSTFPGEAAPRVITSDEIFQGDREILIQHGDQTYRLRVTRANRLILNK